jgi:hypothetical protein
MTCSERIEEITVEKVRVTEAKAHLPALIARAATPESVTS